MASILTAEGIIPPGVLRVVGERVLAPPTHKSRQHTKGGKASRSPGKMKNEWCQTDPQKKFFACNTKAYRHPQYAVWHEMFKKANTGGKG